MKAIASLLDVYPPPASRDQTTGKTMSFSSIPRISLKPPPTDPFEIFARRPSLAAAPNDLWGGQREALQRWAQNRNKRDILISLNTGSGKTILGVLTAQSMANERLGKCVYVCSTIDLVIQTEKEAEKLGITPTSYYRSNFSSSGFEQGKTFCITTYASVFNAQTTFRKHDVRRFVFDDAHVAEKAIRDSFTLTITRSEYAELFDQVAQMLAPIFSAAGQAMKFREVLEQRDTGILLLPPTLALQFSDELSNCLSEILKKLEQQKRLSLMYPYLYLRDRIKLCALTVSSGAIEISPPFLPSAITYPFAQNDSRRVYLSATMRTQAEFSRAFGRRPDFVIEPETDAGNGERCILFGQSVPEEDTGPKLVAAIKAKQKLVIACRSYRDASLWQNLAIIPEAEQFSSALNRFREGKDRAFVLVARVDGIDLPDDTCRVMLIDNLPTGYTQIERFMIEHCSMTSLGATKLASRITQVFGRINRGRKDYGVFILRGRQLNNWLSDAQNIALLPELLQKQLLLGEQISYAMLRNKNYEAILSVLDKVMARDGEWITTYGDRIADAEIPSEVRASAKEKDDRLTDAAISEADAMQLAWRGDFAAAAAALAGTADQAAFADARLGGWHNLWLGWFYQLAGDGQAAAAEYGRARSRLGAAVYVPKPAPTAVPSGQKVTLRGARIAELVSEEHVSRFEMEVSIIANRLAPLGQNDATSAQHEEATRALGEALGFTSSRPDNMFHTGPDVIWIDEEAKSCLLFELKTLQGDAKPITKKSVSQGHDHVQWVKNHHPSLSTGLIFVAPTEACGHDANPSSDMRAGPLEKIHQVGLEFMTEVRSIRNSLPLERLIKVNQFADRPENSLDGITRRIAPATLTNQ